jgi:hypothetical protein
MKRRCCFRIVYHLLVDRHKLNLPRCLEEKVDELCIHPPQGSYLSFVIYGGPGNVFCMIYVYGRVPHSLWGW